MFHRSLVPSKLLLSQCSRIITKREVSFDISSQTIRQFNTLRKLQYIAKPTQIPRKITKVDLKDGKAGSPFNPSFTRAQEEMTSYLNHPIKPVVSATTCEEYDLSKVTSLLTSKGISNSEIVSGETVYFKYPLISGVGLGDVFVMKSGTVIAWNVEENEVINSIAPLIKDSMVTPYNVETEDLDFVDLDLAEGVVGITNAGSFVSKEIICLRGSDEETLLDKVAFSYGISRSTRLAILESSLEKHIKLTKKTTENLSKGKHLGVSAKDVITSSGRLLLLRGKLNLYSELIETPDLYWDEPSLEKIYNDISKVLDVSSRVNMLNRKLDYASEEAQSLVDLLKSRKESRLEWIIIYLIVIEVCFETYHFYERFIEKSDQHEAKN